MFRQAGVIQVDTLDEMFDVAQLLAHQPLADGAAGRRGRQLRRARPAGRRRGRGRRASSVEQSVSLGADASAEDFERALDAAIDNPAVDAVVAVFIPPLDTTRRAGGARCWPRSASSPTSRSCRRSSAARACPSCCACPTWRARPGAGRCRRTRRPRLRCGRWPGSSRTRSGSNRPQGAVPCVRGHRRRRRARQVVTKLLREMPEGGDARRRPVARAAAATTGSRSSRRSRVDVAGRGDRGRGAATAGTSCSRRRADHLRQRPDLAHVWRNIDDDERHERGLGQPRRR